MSLDNKNSIWDKISVIIVAVVFFCFVLFCWFKPATDISSVERRQLAKKPELTLDNVTSGKFMQGFETYAVDQIPLRQPYRNLKAMYTTYVLGQKDNNGLVIYDNSIIDMDYTLNEESLDYAAGRIDRVYDKYLADKDVNIYFSIIPDKNYYNEGKFNLKYDYYDMVEKMCNNIEYAAYIDIFDELSLEDYYRTDTHWKQEQIIPVAEKLGEAMGADVKSQYETMAVEDKFYGVYYGQMALPVDGDDMYYLTNEEIENCLVYDYEKGREISLYDLDATSGNDPYEMYLYGPLSLVTITNPNADTHKELIIFRDSFGSSIAPLLVSGYSEITLVDIRYISPEYLGNFVEFDNQDVLFLYSSSVLNHSETIK